MSLKRRDFLAGAGAVVATTSLGLGATPGGQEASSPGPRFNIMFPWPIWPSCFPLPKRYFSGKVHYSVEILRELATLLGGLGYQGIDISSSWMVSPDLILEAVDGTGIVVSNIGGPGTLQIPKSAGEKWARGMDNTRKCMELAKALGCPSIGDHYLPFTDKLDAKDQPLIDNLKELAPDLERTGLRLDLEGMFNSNATGPIDIQRHTVDIIRAVGSPRIKVVSDFWHMSMQGNDVAEALTRYGNYTGVCHLHESAKNTLPGDSGFDYRPAFRALKKWDYSGWLLMEAIPADHDLETGLARTLRYVKQQWSEA